MLIPEVKNMLHRQNSLRNLYQILDVLKGLSQKEVRLVYAAGGALVGSVILALLLHLAIAEGQKVVPADAAVHFSCQKIVLENRFPEALPVEAAPSSTETVPMKDEEAQLSDRKNVWYFDEIHQDWRCRKEESVS